MSAAAQIPKHRLTHVLLPSGLVFGQVNLAKN